MRNVLRLAALLNVAGAPSAHSGSVAQAKPESPFVGSWTADLSQSRFDPKFPFKGADLTISVNGNVVTVASSVMLPDGKAQKGTETLRADGTETPGTLSPGIVHVANWVGSHVLAFIARKGDQNVALITYEVSADGGTLTARTSGIAESVVVFKRR